MIISEEKATRRFLDKLQDEKWNYSVVYCNGKAKQVKLSGMTINLKEETINFTLGLEEFEGFDYIAKEIMAIKVFLNELKTAKEINGRSDIEDTASLIN